MGIFVNVAVKACISMKVPRNTISAPYSFENDVTNSFLVFHFVRDRLRERCDVVSDFVLNVAGERSDAGREGSLWVNWSRGCGTKAEFHVSSACPGLFDYY